MKYYIEIGRNIDDGEISRRMKSWTGWEHVDVVITVHAPNIEFGKSGHGTQKSFKKALDWVLQEVRALWPEDV